MYSDLSMTADLVSSAEGFRFLEPLSELFNIIEDFCFFMHYV
jgi:hypothetical protein